PVWTISMLPSCPSLLLCHIHNNLQDLRWGISLFCRKSIPSDSFCQIFFWNFFFFSTKTRKKKGKTAGNAGKSRGKGSQAWENVNPLSEDLNSAWLRKKIQRGRVPPLGKGIFSR